MFPLKPKMLITKIIRKWERCKIVRRETANASEMFQAFLICPAINHVSKKEINTRPNLGLKREWWSSFLWMWITMWLLTVKQMEKDMTAIFDGLDPPQWWIKIILDPLSRSARTFLWLIQSDVCGVFFFCYPIMNIPLCQPLPPPPTNKLWGIRRYDCWFSLELINELSRFICSHVPTESPNSIQVISLGRSQNTPYAPTDAKM